MPTETVLVAGPPCAGKTTWCRQHAHPGDLVLDQDELGPARYLHALDHQLPAHPGRALVVRCLPGAAERTAFAERIRATRVELLCPPTHVLMQRAQSRPDPARRIAAVQAWLDAEAGRVRASVAAADPTPTSRTWW